MISKNTKVRLYVAVYYKTDCHVLLRGMDDDRRDREKLENF